MAGRMGRPRPRQVLVVAAVSLGLALAGCGRTGEATTRIDQAESEIDELVDAIVVATGLEVTQERELGSRQRCQQVTGDEGASNSRSVRGPVPPGDDPVGPGASVLVGAGYELVDTPELGEGVFGRRDGIRITVFVDAPTQQLAVDANTGCRPLPR
jgi:outer membrane murein-binding lipoprotein Lpp